MFTMGNTVMIIDPQHYRCGSKGKIVGLKHEPPNQIVYTVETETENFPAYEGQMVRYVDLAELDDLPVQPNESYLDSFDEFRFLCEVWTRELDQEKAATGGYDYEHIGLPPVTNEIDGAE